jgi:hypothetical protein
LQVRFAQLALFLVARQKNLCDRIAANLWQFGIEQPFGLGSHQLVGNSGEHSGAVARVSFAAACAAMIHVLQGLGRVAHDAVAAHALDMRDEPHAAAIFFVSRVVKPMFLGPSIF